jgi:hypothetical protein
MACVLACTGAVAHAAITHEFLQPLSEKLEEGVPADCAGQLIPPCITGPLSGVSALTVDSGHLWVAERIEAGKKLGKSRVDASDDATGQFRVPQLDEEGGVEALDVAVAVGHAGGEEQVYVGAGHVVAVFGPSGKLQPAGVWSGEHTPNKSFGEIAGVAVDASTNLETHGDLYVATSHFGGGTDVVDVFAPQAGGAEPAEVIGQLTGPPSGPFARPMGVAVSPNGDVLVADGDQEECARGKAQCFIDVFEPVAGTPGAFVFLFAIPGAPGEPFKRIGPMAVDGEGDIYVVEKQTNVVEQFNAAGEYVMRLTGTPQGPFKELRSVAADPINNNLYAGDFDQAQKTGAVDAFGPSSIVPDVTSTPATAIGIDGEGKVAATLNGTVNPLNQGPATCQFVWGTTEAFGNVAPCEPQSVPDGSTPVAVKATVKELAPDTTYVFRLQASNHNGTNTGEPSDDREFQTPGPGIHGESATEVASTSATLNATIDPDNAPTSYYFQYGKSTAYEAQAPASPASLGEGKGDVQLAQHVQGLAPGGVYHYRVVAVSQLNVEGKPTPVSFASPDQTFMTQAAASGEVLSDGRHWELVSPRDKHGALLLAVGGAGVIQAADSGDAVTYLTTIPTEEGVKGFIYGGVQALATRGAGGWSSQEISLAHASASGVPIGVGQEYRAFSPELAQALVEPRGEFTSLAPEAFPPDTDRTPYVRHDFTCVFEPASCFEPLLVGCPPSGQACAPAVAENADVPAGTQFGGDPGGGEQRFMLGEARFVGATSDLSHAILSSRVALTATPTGGQPELYEWAADKPPAQQLSLVSVLPNEKGKEALGEQVHLGFEDAIARHAVSEDGARVVWSAGVHLYVRDVGKGQTLQLDLPGAQCLAVGECGDGEASARFQLASTDGSRVLFTDVQRLSADAGETPNTADLYECDISEVAGKLSCELSDLTPAPGLRQSADVQGATVGASEDASWVYFVANGALGDGAQRGAVAGDCKLKGTKGEGQCNLYVHHEGATQLVATLAGEDYPDWTGLAGLDLSKLTARVSPDGHWLAFMSSRPLSGYDNRDAASAKPDEEVFLYHAQGGGASSVICASCDPSGARPVGVEYEQISQQLVGGDTVWNDHTWIAANIPGWTPYQVGRALYHSRYLSDSGRLFFNANGALVAQDINKDQDVYQYEPSGVGDCSSASATFNAASVGCVALISSGRAAGESAFLDASASGADVFFLTAERLVEKDVDTALDLYDAHVCSAGAPCTEEPQRPPPCTTAESCRAAPAPQPDIFGSPSSSTFSGHGNLTPAPTPKPVITPQQRLQKAVAACRHKYKHAKKRRIRCERQARMRYGPKKAKKAAGRAMRGRR